jgi:flagellar biosynthesis component FlhA
MSPIHLALLSVISVFGGAVLGIFLRAMLPPHHLSAATKDTVKLSMGLVATMTALLLGLLVASAKGSYDAQKSQLIQMSAKLAFLDRVLSNCGPDAPEARAVLRMSAERMIARIWPDDNSRQAELAPSASAGQALYESIQKISPQTDAQRSVKTQALQTTVEIGQMYWLLFQQAGTSISTPLLIVVVFWLAMIFLSFGLFTPRNGTAITALMASALSVCVAIFLLLELDHPFSGWIGISSEPMRNALEHLGR